MFLKRKRTEMDDFAIQKYLDVNQKYLIFQEITIF